jgi:hypothetical protein
MAVVVLAAGVAAFLATRPRPPAPPSAATVRKTPVPPLDQPIRAEPARFPVGTHLPPIKEILISGPIDLQTFSPTGSLTRVDDRRVWWESDHDRSEAEDDHIVNRSLEQPLRRLIELVTQNSGVLEVRDAYRPMGIHKQISLHKEGRAVDVTCSNMPLDRLAKLSWAAGFDWVYLEGRNGQASHVHCSVRR